MAVSILYPSSTACQAAGIDKQRFNEAVAAGRYPCAPAVRKGGTRTFRRDDIVALFVFARLIEQDIPARVAGEIACALRTKLDAFPNARELKVPRYSEQGKTPIVQETGTSPPEYEEHSVLVQMAFDVAGIRNEIGRRLKNEAGTTKQDD
ncbi:hypothetical protein P6F26_18500 [Roseibacterium sp. SDUM158017]|uniref:hypothetical protein n=1 Tax=Roseicyclus salinarum TaxID=3036773 RepID=UPI00241524F2|nr:hypothetical protein [Roseibacterium sp. SDUM158017]MDG4650438.1 hypothetical protein [Roseibacterium sp. SDUM158017]